MSNFLKKLNDFRCTAVYLLVTHFIAASYALASLFLYHFSHEIDPRSKGLFRFVGFKNVEGGPYLGMVLFFMAIISFFIAIFIIYSLIPFIKNKDKLVPRKGLLVTSFVNSFFLFGLMVFNILLVALDKPQTAVGIYAFLPFGLFAIVCSALFLIPYKRCDFYMPAIKQ